MKSGMIVFVMATFFLAAAGPARAFECPSLVAEGRGKLASVKDEKLRAEAKKLLDKALAMHNDGDHDNAVATANKALGMIGK